MNVKTAAVVLAVFLVSAAVMYGALKDLKTVPGPLYGGDVYFQLGQIYRMYEEPASEWFGTSNGIGILPAYFPVYGILAMVFGKILGLAPVYADIGFNYVLLPLSLAMVFVLLRKIFGEGAAAAGVALAMAYFAFPIFKYTDFTKVLIVPLFTYALYSFYTKQDAKSSAFLGIAYGILSLSHSSGFIFGSAAIAAFYFILFWKDIRGLKNADGLFEFAKRRKEIFIAPVLGFLIAQLYWFAPIFVYLGKSGLKSYLWSIEDYRNLEYSISFAIGIMARQFFDFSNLLTMAKSALALFGLYLVFVKKQGTPFVKEFFIISSAMTFSYLVTSPLLDIHFLPAYMENLYLSLAVLMVALEGAKKLMEKYENIIIIAVLVCFLQSAFALGESLGKDDYFKGAKDGLPPAYESLQAYLLMNTSHSDVILSTNELSFMANAISGRGVMVSRRAHNDAFTQDFDQRQMDAMAILYGNGEQARKWLLKKYNVSYIYFDTSWYGSEFHFDQNGTVVQLFDPLMAVWSPENEAELTKYGIEYYNTTHWLDPSVQGANVRKYKVLIEKPENYDFAGKGPWKDDLDSYLEEVWSWSQGGQKAAVLYRVKYG